LPNRIAAHSLLALHAPVHLHALCTCKSKPDQRSCTCTVQPVPKTIVLSYIAPKHAKAYYQLQVLPNRKCAAASRAVMAVQNVYAYHDSRSWRELSDNIPTRLLQLTTCHIGGYASIKRASCQVVFANSSLKQSILLQSFHTEATTRPSQRHQHCE
jgi:hypothetical protein